MKKIFLFLAAALIHCQVSIGQRLIQQQETSDCEAWVEEMMNKLSDEEKIGQLLMPQITTTAKTNLSPAVKQTIDSYLTKYHAGMFLFSKVTILGQAEIDNEVQRASIGHGLPPALIAIDGEWGVVKRLSDGIAYPTASTIGRIQDVEHRNMLCYQYGREMARQLQLMGVHINFAPVLDVNSNPKNPVINSRAFGTRIDTVVDCGVRYARGLEDGGVLSVAKHFPGHGDTDTDSHLELPRLNHSNELMHERELKPFQAYIDEGLGGMMVAHLDVPSLNGGKKGIPATASRAIVNDLLQTEMQFKGLVFTDGLAMKGVSERKDICVEALIAGCDILVQPTPMETQWQSLMRAMKQGYGKMSAKEFMEMVNEKCRKVLRWKYALVVAQYPLVKGVAYVNTRNLPGAVNTKYATQLNVALRNGGDVSGITDFDPTMQMEEKVSSQTNGGIPSVSAIQTLPRWQPMTEHIDSIAADLVRQNASPGCQILIAHKGEVIYHKAWGWMDADHKEEVSANTYYDLASVTKATATVTALMYCVDNCGVKITDNLQKYLTELKGSSIGRLTIRQCLLHETGIRSAYSFYQDIIDKNSIPEGLYKGQRVAPFTLQQDAKLWFNKNMAWDKLWISNQPVDGFLPVADGLWVNPKFREEMFKTIIALPQKNIGKYRYSDLNFILLRHVIERASKMSIDELLYTKMPELFGQPERLIYKPLEHGMPLTRIAPTENDEAIRRQTLRGYVHDEAAAFSGGIEGNAGLFGNASALFPLLQMLLDDGNAVDPLSHERRRVLKESTVKMFLSGKSGISRRGLGYDKPDMVNVSKSPCSKKCSAQTIGHTGYTGTCFWVDPKEDLVYIFLSNRVAPHRWNSKLTSLGYRTRIQDVIYENLKK